ncbi:hypothetical protein C8F01DRAFT_614137 [Mycena amicta]|nr:hypothetical protein C8F01DRAFT_614137 [Mycena amicta]
MSRKVEISVASFVELSKSTVFQTPFRCEAPVPSHTGRVGSTTPCGQLLGSWKAYYKHLLIKHVSSKTSGGGQQYRCKATRCTANTHSSYKDLKTHIETTHMKHVPLICPMATCQPLRNDFGRAARHNIFLKERELVSHFQSAHGELLGQTVDSDIFLPNHDPQPPPGPLPPPPPLPPDLAIPWAALKLETYPRIEHKSGRWFHQHQRPYEDETSSPTRRTQSLTPQPTPGPSSASTVTRRLLTRTGTVNGASLESIPERRMAFEFENLSVVSWDDEQDCLQPPDAAQPPFLVVQPWGSSGSRVEMVRPPHVPMGLEYKQPPRSIFHDALTAQVLAQSARGEG